MMTLKDPPGAYSWVKPHRKPALCPAGRVGQERRVGSLQTAFPLWFFQLYSGGPTGVGMAVLKSVQEWPLSLQDLDPSTARWQVAGAAVSLPAQCWRTVWGDGAFPSLQAGVACLLLQGVWWGWRAALQWWQVGAWWSGSASYIWSSYRGLGEQPRMQALCVPAVFLPVLFSGPGAFTRISYPLTGALRV